MENNKKKGVVGKTENKSKFHHTEALKVVKVMKRALNTRPKDQTRSRERDLLKQKSQNCFSFSNHQITKVTFFLTKKKKVALFNYFSPGTIRVQRCI